MMKKINIKDLFEFRRRSDKRRYAFVSKLETSNDNDTDISEGGRDYWVRSITALSRAFKENDNSIISDRIDNIINDYEPNMLNKTKIMYDRNLQILHNFEDYDFNELKPSTKIEIIEKGRKKGIINIKNLPIKVLMHQVYSFKNEQDEKFIGSVLFLAKLDNYKPHELGIFAEAVYNFLIENYSDKYFISPENIRIIDVMSTVDINYQMVLNGDIPPLLNSTLDEIVKLKNEVGR